MLFIVHCLVYDEGLGCVDQFVQVALLLLDLEDGFATGLRCHDVAEVYVKALVIGAVVVDEDRIVLAAW